MDIVKLHPSRLFEEDFFYYSHGRGVLGSLIKYPPLHNLVSDIIKVEKEKINELIERCSNMTFWTINDYI